MIRVTRRALATFAPHRRPGYLEAVEAAALRADEEAVWLDEDGYEALRLQYRRCGVGCQLTRILKRWGIVAQEECGCRGYAAQCDSWGPDGCTAREGEILTHLGEQAAARGLPFSRLAARLLLWRAITLARAEAAGGDA